MRWLFFFSKDAELSISFEITYFFYRECIIIQKTHRHLIFIDCVMDIFTTVLSYFQRKRKTSTGRMRTHAWVHRFLSYRKKLYIDFNSMLLFYSYLSFKDWQHLMFMFLHLLELRVRANLFIDILLKYISI